MIEIYARLLIDGADDVPAANIATALETHIAGGSIDVTDEHGHRATVVID